MTSDSNAARLRRILASASHRRADEDLELLARPELRALRLQLELLKPELAFQDHAVRHTIVVFGGARVAPRSRYYEMARAFGRLVGEAGSGPSDNRLVLATGGGPGLMEAANRGASDAGASSIGLGIVLPKEQKPNPYLSPELSFQFRYFALRKMHFMLRARALVAFPGGFGTFDEVFETLCLVQTGKREPIPVVLVGREFWSRAVDFPFLVSEGVIDPADVELFSFAESAQEIWGCIEAWYEARGRSLLE